MAKEKEEPKKGSKAKRKHLLEIRTRQAHDGTLVHHHTYMKDKEDPRTIEPEREAMATSGTPEEAGGHLAEQFGMNGMGGGDDEQAEGEGGGAAPAAGATPEAE